MCVCVCTAKTQSCGNVAIHITTTIESTTTSGGDGSSSMNFAIKGNRNTNGFALNSFRLLRR